MIIGIAGGSASGKSTLARLIESRLTSACPPHTEVRVRVISMDSYFKRGDDVPKLFSPSKQKEVPDHNQPDTPDIPKLIAELDGMISNKEADVFIVEGLMVLHDDNLRQRLDLRIFVETDDDIRVVRRIKRAMSRGSTSLEETADYYFESAAPGYRRFVLPSRQYAQLIVPGNESFETAAEVIANHIVTSVRH